MRYANTRKVHVQAVEPSKSKLVSARTERRIAFDFGGLLVRKRAFQQVGFFVTAPEPHAQELVWAAIDRYGVDNIFIISSESKPENEAKRKEWLSHWGFIGPRGILERHLIFCPSRDKRAAYERYGITCGTDDRLEVFSYVQGLPSLKEMYLVHPDSLVQSAYPRLLEDRRLRMVRNLYELSSSLGLLAHQRFAPAL